MLYVTTARFTRAAVDLARKHNVELVDGAKLADLCPKTRLVVDHCGNMPVQSEDKALREAWMNALGGRLDALRVLDLFAGSGALGIEALSRGAASVVFVENDRDALRAIERNLEKLRLTGARIVRGGAWYSGPEDCQSTARDWYAVMFASYERVAAIIKERRLFGHHGLVSAR